MIITYGDDHRGYPHPDHIRTHDISVAAFEAAGDPERFPDAGPPFQPLKLYYTGWTRVRLQALHDAFVARGEESPYADWLAKWDPETPDRPMTTRIDVGDFLDERRAALLAHRTQVDPGGFWMRLPEEVVREVFPWEEYLLARSLVDASVPDGGYEDDLFSGLRAGASVYGLLLGRLRRPFLRRTEVSPMAKYLSQEWLDECRKLAEDQPVRPGATAKMQYVVTGGPDGDVKYYWVLEDGKLLDSQLGEVDDGDFTLTMTYDDAKKVQTGRARPQRRLHAGPDEGQRQHGQAHVAAAAHQLAGVPGPPGADPGDHRVLGVRLGPLQVAQVAVADQDRPGPLGAGRAGTGRGGGRRGPRPGPASRGRRPGARRCRWPGGSGSR